MAAIGSIRKHSTLLVVVIGGALVAFILGDFMKRSHRRDVNAGKVDGVEITIMDFNNKVDKNVASIKQQEQKTGLTTDETFRVRQQTWEQIVHEILMDKEYKELGIEVTADEMFNLIQGTNPHPLIKQYFADPNTGQYDRNRVLQFLQQYNQLPESVKEQWTSLENYIKEDQLRQKFNALIAQAYYMPKELLQDEYNNLNTNANVTYIAARYSDVPDSLVKVTDNDYQSYYDQHKNEFKEKAARSLEYVVFDVLPSKSDIEKAEKDAQLTWEDFAKTDHPSEFAKGNSDHPYDTAWLTKSELPAPLDSIMFNSKIGSVSKPYFKNYSFTMARLLASERRPDSMSASHILIAYKGAYRAMPEIDRTKEQAQHLADSLLKVLQRDPAKLKALAKEYSDDPSVKKNNGDLGWFADGQMVGPFNDAVEKTPVGKFTVAETPFGFHVIKVDGKKDYEQKVKVAVITQDVVASNDTYQNVFAKASEFVTNAKNLTSFENLAQKDHYQIREAPKVLETTYTIPGMESARDVVRWAFKDGTEVGQVSNVFDMQDQYVIAVVTNRFEAGIPPLDKIKSEIRPFVVNQVKGKYLAEKMNAYNGNMAAVEKAMNLTPQEEDNMTFDSRNLMGFGMENKVIGSVFGMKQGQVSKPIIGNAATFMVKVDKVTPAPTATAVAYNQLLSQLTSQFYQRVNQDYPYVALKEASDIQDNRITFY
ncbi:MAG: peptidylprolyl isomerase [Bacteroidales bacterium]|nr:peptidylprolyl isomerase [Bacteroidales bacterium]